MLMSDNSLSLINHSGGSQNHCKEEGVRCKVKSKHSCNNSNIMDTKARSDATAVGIIRLRYTLIDFKLLIL